jgi:exportin-2 (importin alpha re-exporter)
VVQFFSSNVFADLDAQEGSVHPILQVDAIRYLLSFRNQVNAFCSGVQQLLIPFAANQGAINFGAAAAGPASYFAKLCHVHICSHHD